MTITIKSFKTWDEQVEILNQLGNNFLTKNPAAKKKVLAYLKQHGFLAGVDFLLPFYEIILKMELIIKIANLWLAFNLTTYCNYLSLINH